MDVVAPTLALGQSIGRLGCLAAGCCYGRPIASPGAMRWGLTFSSEIAARNTGVPLGVPLYATQLFESAASLTILCVLLIRSRRPHRAGELMGTWLFLYGLCRFFLEFYRGDSGRGSVFDGSITVTQLLACAMVALGGFLLLFSG